MKGEIVTNAGKSVTDVATAGYCNTSKLKDEIKGMVDRALMIYPLSSSSAEGKVSALVTNVDFMALGDLYLTNLNSIEDKLSSERSKIRSDIMNKVATMKWKTNLHLNKTEHNVGSLVEQLGEETTKCLQKLKRKAPTTSKEEGLKKSKKDGDHDDQGPGHHEGEKEADPKPTEASELKTSEPPIIQAK